MYKKVALILIVFVSSLFANDISLLIKELKEAPASKRYIIMNKIKMELAKLNSSQRAKCIAQLQKKIQGKKESQHNNKQHMQGGDGFKHQYGKLKPKENIIKHKNKADKKKEHKHKHRHKHKE